MSLPSPQILLEKWIAALRSGKYHQHGNSLANPERTAHCCLGVLCAVVAEEDKNFLWDANQPYLPGALAEHMGLDNAAGRFMPTTEAEKLTAASIEVDGHKYYGLVDMNDNAIHKLTFAQIADALSQQANKIFKWAGKPASETPPSLIE